MAGAGAAEGEYCFHDLCGCAVSLRGGLHRWLRQCSDYPMGSGVLRTLFNFGLAAFAAFGYPDFTAAR